MLRRPHREERNMEYSISHLAKLSGVSTRTLRYYDEIRLLSPRRVSSNGYRVYGAREVERLQEILFYRELGVSLPEIGRILSAGDYDEIGALERHHAALQARRAQIDLLLRNVEKTISAKKGVRPMKDRERFEGFKKKMVEENEARYGREIREKYGDAVVEESNAKLMGLSQADCDEVEALSREVNATLLAAMETGDPESALAQKTCALHREWLGHFWSGYSKEAHLGLVEGYVTDLRFKKHYDALGEGAAEFLRDAMRIFLG